MNITVIKRTTNSQTMQPEIYMKVEMSIEWLQDQRARLSSDEFERIIGRTFITAIEEQQ